MKLPYGSNIQSRKECCYYTHNARNSENVRKRPMVSCRCTEPSSATFCEHRSVFIEPFSLVPYLMSEYKQYRQIIGEVKDSCNERMHTNESVADHHYCLSHIFNVNPSILKNYNRGKRPQHQNRRER